MAQASLPAARVGSDYDRLPPHDIEAEKCYLASLMLEPDNVAKKKMRHLVSRDVFYLTDHAILFDAIAERVDSGKAVDAVLVRADLVAKNLYEEIGGKEYLAEVLGSVPTSAHGEHYAQIVNDRAMRRNAISKAMELIRRMYAPADDVTANGAIKAAARSLIGITNEHKRIDIFSMADMLDQFITSKEEKKPAALLTGIPTLDKYVGVFSFGKYTVFGGRPSMGKSTALRWLLGQWSRQGTPCGLIAIEEDRHKIAGNYLSSESGILNHRVANDDFNTEQWAEIMRAASTLSPQPWWGVDSAFSLTEVTHAFERLYEEKGCKVIGVDHIHLITPDRKSDNEQREVKEISNRLKELGKKTGVVMVVAAQLSRPADKVRKPARPTLTDLRASGAIEEHADGVILLHRPSYYEPEKRHVVCDCEWIIAKNRNGERGLEVLTAELQYQRFKEKEEGSGPAPEVDNEDLF